MPVICCPISRYQDYIYGKEIVKAQVLSIAEQGLSQCEKMLQMYCLLSLVDALLKPRSHCADHSLPMFPIIADRPDLS